MTMTDLFNALESLGCEPVTATFGEEISAIAVTIDHLRVVQVDRHGRMALTASHLDQPFAIAPDEPTLWRVIELCRAYQAGLIAANERKR